MTDLSNQERAVFGDNAKRNPDGSVRERGIGAPVVHPGTEAHDAVAVTRNLATDFAAALKVMVVQAEALAKQAHESMGLTAKATAAHLAADQKVAAPVATGGVLTAEQVKAQTDEKAAADRAEAKRRADEKAAEKKPALVDG